MKNKKSVNITQACEFLGCSRAYVYKLYAEGRIDGYRLGERQGLRFYLDSLEKFVQDRYGL